MRFRRSRFQLDLITASLPCEEAAHARASVREFDLPYNTINGSFSVVRGDSIGESDIDLYIVYAAVPEPGTLALASFGLAGAALVIRRRRRGHQKSA